MLPAICPACSYRGDLEGFLVEVEARRAIASVAALDPAVGRVLPAYLRLFSSGKRGIQLRRAVKLIDELVVLIEAGGVCRDERVGVRRPATPAMWAQGIERMLAEPPSGPLQNHHYLRAVVFGLADQVDAQAERQREEDARAGRRTEPAPRCTDDPVRNAMAYARQMVEFGRFTKDEAEEYVGRARIKAGGAPA